MATISNMAALRLLQAAPGTWLLPVLLALQVVAMTAASAEIDAEQPVSSAGAGESGPAGMAGARVSTPKANGGSEPTSQSRYGIVEGVVGMVLDGSGNPLADVLVQAAPIGPHAGPVPEIAILTNNHGLYVWPLPPGRYSLTVAPPGRDEQRKEARVRVRGITSVNFIFH